MKLVQNYNTSNADQSGETTTPERPSFTLGNIVITAIKVCMILDKQSWSAVGNPETPQVQWNEVFSTRQQQ